MINVIAAIFLATVRRAIVGFIPLARNKGACATVTEGEELMNRNDQRILAACNLAHGLQSIELLVEELCREDLGGGFFQRRLAENRGSTPRERRVWRAGIYDHIRDVMSLQCGLDIERMCLLTGVSRAGFYRYLRAQDSWDEEMGLRSEIQRIVVTHHGRYGYRRMTAELRRRGMLVSHKRVARLMREDALVGTELQWSSVSTDAQGHSEIYINLAKRMKLTGTNQLWVADITFVRFGRNWES
jgi:hypothetical protein